MSDYLDSDGYPTEAALQKIETWEHKDYYNLVLFLESLWAYGEWGFVKRWGYTKRHLHKRFVLFLELHTAGWSGNEDIIRALDKNRIFNIWWVRSDVGGHYYYEINLNAIGFYLSVDLCKEKKFTRQYLSKAADKFERIVATPKKILYRATPPPIGNIKQ